jgi:hypothetical protein
MPDLFYGSFGETQLVLLFQYGNTFPVSDRLAQIGCAATPDLLANGLNSSCVRGRNLSELFITSFRSIPMLNNQRQLGRAQDYSHSATPPHSPGSHDGRTFMLRAAERPLGAGLLLTVVIMLSGCGGTSATPAGAAALSSAPSGGASSNPGASGGTPSSGSGSVTSTPPNPTPQPTPIIVDTIYVPTSGLTDLGTTGYNIDPNSGHLKKIGDFAITGFKSFVADPLHAYTSDPQHRIYVRNGGPSQCDRGNCSADTVFSTVMRNTATGMLSIGMNNVVVPKRFNGMAILPSAKFAYAVEWVQPDDPTTFRIRGFHVDQVSGTLTQVDIGDVPVGNWGPLFAHPKLPFLYEFEDVCYASGCSVLPVTKLHIWSVDDNTGRPTEINGSPTTLAKAAEYFPTISNDGTFFYGATQIANGPDSPQPHFEIDVMRIAGNGVPDGQPLASITSLVSPEFETFLVHPGGAIVYGWGWHTTASPGETATIHAYRFDANTNSFSDLDLTAKVPRVDLMPLGFDASGNYFYLGRSADLPFAVYNVNPDSGDLTLVSYGPVN